jgi:hypothetical protein
MVKHEANNINNNLFNLLIIKGIDRYLSYADKTCSCVTKTSQACLYGFDIDSISHFLTRHRWCIENHKNHHGAKKVQYLLKRPILVRLFCILEWHKY